MEDDTIELTDLVVIDKANALDVFAAERTPKGHPIDPILEKLRAKIDAFAGDMATAKGRDEIRSFAAKIAKSKTAMLKIGEDLTREQKKIPNRIIATRNYIEEKINEWRDEVRAPLTEWEAKEEARVNEIKQKLDQLKEFGSGHTELSAAVLSDLWKQVEAIETGEESFSEYADAAEELKNAALGHISDQMAKAMKREADAAELEALRAEAENRKALEELADRKAEEFRRIKAAEQAATEKERAAAAEREKALIAEKEAAEKAASETEARVKREADEAAEAQRAADAKRAADVEHRRKINAAAAKALIDGGVEFEAGRLAVKLIVEGKVPNVSIKY